MKLFELWTYSNYGDIQIMEIFYSRETFDLQGFELKREKKIHCSKGENKHTLLIIFFMKPRFRGSSDDVLWLLSDLLLRGVDPVAEGSSLTLDLLCRLVLFLLLALPLLVLELVLVDVVVGVNTPCNFSRSSLMSSFSSSCLFG